MRGPAEPPESSTPAALSAAEVQRLVDQVGHWHHVMRFPHGVVSPGAYDPGDLFRRLGLTDLAGRRVLDVGARDGYFAFECEKLGAEVVAVDHAVPAATGFLAAKEILGSRVEYVQANVYDLTPRGYGTFDVVLFLGVVYHLRHPLLALDRLRALCRGTLFLESLACDASFFVGPGEIVPLASVAPRIADLPIAEFMPGGRFHRDWTNKWAPNRACLRAWLEDSLFEVEDEQCWGDRALLRARVREDERVQRRVAIDAGFW